MFVPRPLLLALIVTGFASAADDYVPGPDSLPQPGVPKGEVLKFEFTNSQIFPGTVCDYWVYIPAQYDAKKAACVHVNQDGIQWQAPVVFDNLIAKKEMPITIGCLRHARSRPCPRWRGRAGPLQPRRGV